MSSPAPSLGETHALKCELAGEVLRLSGRLRLQVTGWSMLPTIRPGDTLLIDNVGGDEIFEGDVVLFAHERRLVAHRVVTKSEATEAPMVQTQGDAVRQLDRPVGVCEVMGRVSYIVRGGKLLKSRKTLQPAERAVAALLRRSSVCARIIERGLTMRHAVQDRAIPCQP